MPTATTGAPDQRTGSRHACYYRDMQGNRFDATLVSLRRKLRALAAVAGDSGATASERANAEALKKRLEDRLRNTEIRAPTGDWTDHVFRLGRWAREVRQSVSPAIGNRDLTDNAHRLGKAVRRGYKKWFAD
jgi:hypothetical protein